MTTVITIGDGELMQPLQALASDVKRDAICEAVTWLAQHHSEFKPELLAGEMAKALQINARIIEVPE